MARKTGKAGSLQGLDPTSAKAGQLFASAAAAYTKRATASKKSALATLNREGILTPTGRLKKRYSLTKG